MRHGTQLVFNLVFLETLLANCAGAHAILCQRTLESGCVDWPAAKPFAADLETFCFESRNKKHQFQGFGKVLALRVPAPIFRLLDSLRWTDEKL